MTAASAAITQDGPGDAVTLTIRFIADTGSTFADAPQAGTVGVIDDGEVITDGVKITLPPEYDLDTELDTGTTPNVIEPDGIGRYRDRGQDPNDCGPSSGGTG